MEDDSDDKDDTKRRTRNLSEKKRRDTFNMLINELCSMVSTNNRKMDKSTVLKSTISFLRNHKEVSVRSRAHEVQDNWKPPFLSNEEFTYLMIEAVEGFVMVFTVTGQIYYVSESVTSLLGHNPADLINTSVYDLAYEHDQPNMYNIVQNLKRAHDHAQPSEGGEDFHFHCHLRRNSLDISDETTYELIQFNGHFRTNMEHMEVEEACAYPEHESRLLFVCIGRLCTPQLIRDVSLIDSNRCEFTSRYSLEWKYLFLDHRAPPIIGYLPFEVLGTSGYDYYHYDDWDKVLSCHKALMEKGEITSCYYRFLTKGQQWIWLQTRFYISYHQWNAKPEFVVCMHRVVSYADVVKATRQAAREAAVAAAANVAAAAEAAAEVAAEAIAKAAAEAEVNDVEMNMSSKDAMATLSPTYMTEAGETYTGSYPPLSQPASVKSASAGSTTGTVASVGTAATTAASWPCTSQMQYAPGSDTASVSGESYSSQRNSSRGKSAAIPRPGMYGPYHGNMMMFPQTHKGPEPMLVPQHGIGAQYLEPAPYIGTVGVPGVLPVPLPSLPVIVSSDQAEIQLQRKHEELQQMIVRQQEELRRVKEQLVLARLGIMQPIINVQVPNAYVTAEEIQQNQRMPPQIIFDDGETRAIPGYPQQQPPPSNDHHENMQQ